MKGPSKPVEEEPEPPACLTDGLNEQLPRDYIRKWKVNDKNVEQRLKELEYTLKLLKSKGMVELVANPKNYDRDIYLLSKGMFRMHNNKKANRERLFLFLLDIGVVEFVKDYWNAINAEFDLKRIDADETLNNGQLWEYYTTNQKNIVDSLKNIYQLLNILWNGSDMSVQETLEVVYDSIIDFILMNLDTYLHPLEKVESSHPQHMTVKACLGVLHNICNKYDNCLPDLRKKDALRIIGNFRNSGTNTLRTKSILGCSYLLSEQDDANKAVLELDESDITFVIKVLRDTLVSPNQKSNKYGYDAEELIEGLNNIAVVESNKERLVQAGVLPLYVDAMTKDNNPSLQEWAARAIWNLAFDDESMRRIKEEPGCVHELETLKESGNPSLKAAAEGALWKLEGQTKHLQQLNSKEVSADKTPAKKLKHIMISYQWDVQDQVLKFRDRLKAEGYRVWIDVEQMSGSTTTAMAKAVEHAAVLVPVLTEKYKASPACRQEAEYANALHRKFVPIRLQPKYKPDGWLGFLLGSTFFYDLTKKAEYENKFRDFIQSLGNDGKIQPGEDENPVIELDEDVVDDSFTPYAPQGQGVVNLNSAPVFDVQKLICLPWTCERVNEWLTKHKLGKYIEKLADVDGLLLAELIAMRFTSSEVYYELMRQEFGMLTLDLLRMNAAIRKLANAR